MRKLERYAISPLMIKLFVGVLVTSFSVLACAQIQKGISMETEQEKAQVLDLVQRIMRAAEADVLGDEALGAKALGFEIQEWVEMKMEYAKIPHREIVTGISILDKSSTKEHVSYSAPNRVDYFWGAGVRSIGYLVCIRQAEIEALYGKPHKMATPLHGERAVVGSYYYIKETPLGIRTATFEYILRDNGLECLHSFSVHLAPHQSPFTPK